MNTDWSRIVARSGIPINNEAIKRFENALGYGLPDEYRTFLLNVNGGDVLIDHNIPSEELGCDIGIDFFYPLTAPRPSLGIIEARDLQTRQHLAVKHSIAIAGDMGTGSYYLLLAGKQRGAVYFIWNDHNQFQSPEEWITNEDSLNNNMVFVSERFEGLAFLIQRYQCND